MPRTSLFLFALFTAGCQPNGKKASSTDTATTADTSPAGPQVCRAANLQIALAGSDAGAGQRGMTFSIRNTGNRPCLTGGYPVLRLIDSSGSNLDSISPRAEPGFPDSTFALAPDSLASFQITYPGIPAGITCYQAASLEVIPHGAADTLRITTPIAPCGDHINVRPIVRGVPPV